MWINDDPTTDLVGPVLEANDISLAVISAIELMNERVQVRNVGSYLRVLVPHKCEVTRERIEAVLGFPFDLPSDLERIMPSFKGIFKVHRRPGYLDVGK